MTTEREEALELAREVGLETRTLNSIDPDEIVVDQVIITDEIERLVRLAKQRGAEEEREACADLCESDGGGHRDVFGQHCAAIIRMRSNLPSQPTTAPESKQQK